MSRNIRDFITQAMPPVPGTRFQVRSCKAWSTPIYDLDSDNNGNINYSFLRSYSTVVGLIVRAAGMPHGVALIPSHYSTTTDGHISRWLRDSSDVYNGIIRLNLYNSSCDISTVHASAPVLYSTLKPLLTLSSNNYSMTFRAPYSRAIHTDADYNNLLNVLGLFDSLNALSRELYGVPVSAFGVTWETSTVVNNWIQTLVDLLK